MSGAVPVLPLYAVMAWPETTLPLPFFVCGTTNQLGPRTPYC
jgi:hypothetical protein